MLFSNYALSREDILHIIKKEKKTKDGNYWAPKIMNIMLIKGKVKDTEYYYERSLFKNKMYFSPIDIEIFLSKEPFSDLDIDEWSKKTLRFYETNKELADFDVNEYLPSQDFSVAELIDMYEYLITI